MFHYAILNRYGVITSTYASPVKMRTSKYLVEISEKDMGVVNVSSDERLKKNIADTDRAELAAFVGKLPVKTYQYKDDEALELDRIGLIAQDVIKADPKLSRYFVSVDEKGFYGLKPADLVFPLIAAVQKLQDEVEQLKK